MSTNKKVDLTDRAAITERSLQVWRELIKGESSEKAWKTAFSDWGGADHGKIWRNVLGAARADKVMAILAGGGTDPDVKRRAVAQALVNFDELVRLRDAAELLDTGSITAMPMVVAAGGGQNAEAGEPEQPQAPVDPVASPHEQEVGQAMAERAAEHGAAAAGLIGEYVDQQVALKVRSTRIDESAANAVGATGAAAAEMVAAAGQDKRVDRVDAALLDLARARAETLLRSAGIELARSSTGARQVPAPAVVNAALAMVLRAAGVPGIELSDHGELLCEVLGSEGDLARTATLDARLKIMGEKIDAIAEVSRRTHDRTMAIERGGWLSNMMTSFSIAERLGVVRTRGVREEAAKNLDLADPAVLGLLSRMAEQAASESDRRSRAKGRPSAAAAQKRRSAKGGG